MGDADLNLLFDILFFLGESYSCGRFDVEEYMDTLRTLVKHLGYIQLHVLDLTLGVQKTRNIYNPARTL